MQKGDSSVLKILRLMSQDDVRQMTASHQVQKAVNLPMAAGAEGISQWETPRQEKPRVGPENNVLSFPRRGPDPESPRVPEESQEASSEVELHMHRDMFKIRDEQLLQKEGVKLYKQSTEVHMYRASKEKGSKLKFAHTNGVLINKKQD